MADTLFSYIEHLHGDADWGTILDAGTGRKSIDWISSLDTSAWTAVTGEAAVARSLAAEYDQQMRPADRILSGNWTDPALLYGERYDVVLADYLLVPSPVLLPTSRTGFLPVFGRWCANASTSSV